MSEVKNIFGVSDTDESLKGKSGGGRFGLNVGNVTKIEFLDNAGKDNGPANAVDIHVQIGDREYRRRLYETTGDLFGPKNTKVAPGEEGYEDLFYADMGQKIAVIKHALKAVGVTDEVIAKTSASLDPTKIAEGMKALASLAPADLSKASVDVFLEYQWEIAEDQDRTYPELPKNMKGGKFLVPSVTPIGGKWNEVRDEKGLHYTDDAGNVHPFDRDANFMDGNKGTQQGVGASAAANNMSGSAAGEQPKKSTW